MKIEKRNSERAGGYRKRRGKEEEEKRMNWLKGRSERRHNRLT